jgi:hypothetical protein
LLKERDGTHPGHRGYGRPAHGQNRDHGRIFADNRFRRRFGEENQAPAEPVSNQVVDDELEKLAQGRAEAVNAYLIEQAGIDAARIHVQPVQINNEPVGENGVVTFSLSVI